MNADKVGFRKPVQSQRTAAQFTKSKYAVDLNMLDAPTNMPLHKRKDALIIKLSSPYKSWRQCIAQNPKINYFLVTPGDYRKWGDFRPPSSGTLQQMKVLMYYNPETASPYSPPHPVQLKTLKKEVVIERFRFHEISNWVMHGITFRGNQTERRGKWGGLYNSFEEEANNNVLNYCLIEQVVTGNGIRISNSHNNTIQNCVIRDKIEGFTSDNIGITISATQGRVSRGNKVVDNEIYDVTDGVQLLYMEKKGRNAPTTGEVPGTIIDNNDLYITKRLYTYKDGEEKACAEDGVDIKVGTKSSLASDKVRVTNNRIWGFRTTDTSCSGSSHGSGIVIHRNASNILIENNVMFDVSRGISIGPGTSKQFPNEKVTDITVINNIFYNINDKSDNSGYALVSYMDARFEHNTIKKAKFYLGTGNTISGLFANNLILDCPQPPFKVHRNARTFKGNYWVVDRYTKHIEDSKAEQQNRVVLTSRYSVQGDYVFYRKRWTKPERIIIPDIL